MSEGKEKSVPEKSKFVEDRKSDNEMTTRKGDSCEEDVVILETKKDSFHSEEKSLLVRY